MGGVRGQWNVACWGWVGCYWNETGTFDAKCRITLSLCLMKRLISTGMGGLLRAFLVYIR